LFLNCSSCQVFCFKDSNNLGARSEVFMEVVMKSQVCWDVRLLLWVPELLLSVDDHYIRVMKPT
jgi:hypothetical protein